MASEENEIVGREACPQCRAAGNDTKGDNLVKYSDGGGHCFACGFHQFGDGDGPVKQKTKLQAPKDWKPVRGKVIAIPKRKIPDKIARLYDYRTAQLNDQRVQVACYYAEGKMVGQKIRYPNKDFRVRGAMKSRDKPPLFGQHLWRTGGRRIVVTEGEIDCLSVATMLHGKWPVVSVPNGADHALRSFKNHAEFLNSYQEVIICFDMDEAGQKAALECAKVLRPGKAKIATLPRKDANEMLVNNETAALSTAMWEAKAYRPDGILHASDVMARPASKQPIYPYPWRNMTKALMGQRGGEIVMYTSGTGMGKSTIIREIAMSHLQAGNNVGMLMLEESCDETLDDMTSLMLSQPVRQIKAARQLNAALKAQGMEPIDFDVKDDLDDAEYEKCRKLLSAKGLYLYDHCGTNIADDILPKLEYMATSLDCKIVVLDHISVVVAAMGSGNERQEIDFLMGELRSLVERTGIHLMLVTQLRKADGKAYEEGGRISLQDLRGSGSLSSVPNSVIAVERNQQDPDHDVRNTMIIRSLKGRFNGKTGVVAALRYDKESGRLEETEYYVTPDGDVVFQPPGDEFDDETDF